MPRAPKPTPLAMTILVLLSWEPLHPYGLLQRIREWGKEEFVSVTHRNAIYQTMRWLEQSGLIAVRETTRQSNRADRIIYEATAEGVSAGNEWLREMLSMPVNEYPRFPAALAMVTALRPAEVLAALTARAEAVEDRIAGRDAELRSGAAKYPGGLDRIHLIEDEYQRAMWVAELSWLQGVIADLRAGAFDDSWPPVRADSPL